MQNLKRLTTYNETRVPMAELWRIVKDICAGLDVPLDEVHAARGPTVVTRQIVYWILRRVTGMAYPEMGIMFDKHHTTILHAEQLWADHLSSRPDLQADMEQLLGTVRRAHQARMEGNRYMKVPRIVGRQRRSRMGIARNNSKHGPALAEPQGQDDQVWYGEARPHQPDFFSKQNAKAVKHMRKALAQEAAERNKS